MAYTHLLKHPKDYLLHQAALFPPLAGRNIRNSVLNPRDVTGKAPVDGKCLGSKTLGVMVQVLRAILGQEEPRNLYRAMDMELYDKRLLDGDYLVRISSRVIRKDSSIYSRMRMTSPLYRDRDPTKVVFLMSADSNCSDGCRIIIRVEECAGQQAALRQARMKGYFNNFASIR